MEYYEDPVDIYVDSQVKKLDKVMGIISSITIFLMLAVFIFGVMFYWPEYKPMEDYFCLFCLPVFVLGMLISIPFGNKRLKYFAFMEKYTEAFCRGHHMDFKENRMIHDEDVIAKELQNINMKFDKNLEPIVFEEMQRRKDMQEYPSW